MPFSNFRAEVLNTMEIFEKNYSIPVAVFVVDYFNWAVMGNLTFDPAHWPDPKAMVDTLKSDGTALSGSISTVLTGLSWICVGIHSRTALPCPVCA